MKKLSLILFIMTTLALLHFANLSSYFYNPEQNQAKVRKVRSENIKTLLENILEVERHNEDFSQGKSIFRMRLNSFGEMTPNEFVNKKNGYRKIQVPMGSNRPPIQFKSPSNVILPRAIDWRTLGAVNAIQDQGQCGSCWAFSALGSLEGQLYQRTRRLVDLSEQQLVDCSNEYGNRGCSGGFMESAYRYIRDTGRVNLEAAYPYEGRDGNCRLRSDSNAGSVRDMVTIQPGNETQLMEAVATIGPIAVAMDASRRTFQFYSEGIYFEPNCSSSMLDHGVLLVGYGTTRNGIDYWIVKNSYGTEWGENGYFRIVRNRNNHCGIATDASYPIV